MKALFLTGIFPPDIGGPATYVPQMALSFTQRGHHVTVVTLSDVAQANAIAYPFEVVRLRRDAFKPLRFWRTLREIMRWGRNADVIFVNGLALEGTVANLVLRKPLIVKVVGDLAWERARNRGWVTESFEDFQGRRHGTAVALLKLLRNWWTKQADFVIVPSVYLARWVSNWGVDRSKIRVIYNALEAPDDLATVKVPLATSVKVVTVGRLVSWKHIDEIIEVISKLNDAGVLIIGDGPERSSLENRVRVLGLENRVYFAGQRSHRETLALMGSCDIFVLNSSYEGLPHVILEAMHMALPVVATAVGGVGEVVRDGENGLLIAPRDSGALRDQLERLIQSPIWRKKLSLQAKNTTFQFSYTRMVDETESLVFSLSAKQP